MAAVETFKYYKHKKKVKGAIGIKLKSLVNNSILLTFRVVMSHLVRGHMTETRTRPTCSSISHSERNNFTI